MPLSRIPGPLRPDSLLTNEAEVTRGVRGIRDDAPNDTFRTVGLKSPKGKPGNARFLRLRKLREKVRGEGKGAKELNIVTTFPNPWKKSIKLEIEAIRKNAWEPSTDDFAAFSGKCVQVDHFYQFIGIIINQPRNSVKRINVFTHSNPDTIAFKGEIIPRSTLSEVNLYLSSALTLAMLEKITDSTWFQIDGSKKKHYIKGIQQRFRKNAKVFFYSCKSAMDAELLQCFADKFQVTAAGFREKIAYCPSFTEASIDRRWIGIGSGCKNKSRKFTDLDKHGVFRKPKP